MNGLDEALRHAGIRGWRLVPLVPGQKRPLMKRWQKEASSDMEKIREWARRYPDCGWGFMPGPAKIAVVDIDARSGGFRSFNALRESNGWEPIETPTVTTGGGGQHLYFKTNGREIKTCILRPGLEIRSSSGQVILPPSLHPSGKKYRWELDPDEIEMDPLPRYLAELVDAYEPTTPTVEGDIPEGQRNATLTSLAGSMRRRGMSRDALEAGLLAENNLRCDPPLDIDEVRQITVSVARYEPAEPAGAVARPPKDVKTVDIMGALKALGWEFRLNLLTGDLEVNDVPMTDATRAVIRCELRDHNYKPLEHAEDAILAEGLHNHYHPIREYLAGLTWDGQDHIAKLASYFKDKHDVFETYLHRWLVGSVARVMLSGEQNRVLVLDGKQNLGKSHAVRWLASPFPQYFVEGPIFPDQKDCNVRLTSTWIWEVAELGSTTRKADREALKFFISQQIVTVRKPYGRFDEKKPASASFIGTVNNEAGFLADPTGSRRFMATTLTDIDWAYAKEVDVNQVWAQAYGLFRNGESWHLTKDEARKATEVNTQYEVEDPVEDYLLRYFVIDSEDTESFTLASTVWDQLLAAGIRVGTTRALQMAVAVVLRKYGIESTKKTIAGIRVRGYPGVKAR